MTKVYGYGKMRKSTNMLLKSSRRHFILGAGTVSLWPFGAQASGQGDNALLGPGALSGWWARDLASGRTLGDNPDIHLPMCSSFKWLLAAAILARTDSGDEDLKRRLFIEESDIVYNSPAVEKAFKAADGERASMSVGALCEATVSLSDSAAANLLLATLGGPAGLTHWLRANGDADTRLDRYELDMNMVPPGDMRDTTTPRAMVGNLKRVLFGPSLSERSQGLLCSWLLAAKPGANRMPAGLRPGWRIGHKTGTWMVDPGHAPEERAASGDVAILIPPKGLPVLLAAYTAGSEKPQSDVDHWFAGLVSKATDPQWLLRD